MTKLATRKSKLRFTTGAEVRYRGKLRAVVVEVDNEFTFSMRLSGTQLRYPCSFGGTFAYWAERFGRSEKLRRKKERMERRKAVA